MKSLRDVFPKDTPRITQELSEVELDGVTRLLTFAPVKGLPGVAWHVGLSIDKAKAYAMLSTFRTSAIIAHHLPAQSVDSGADASLAHHG